MTISVLVCSYGEEFWRKLAFERAYASCRGQGATQVLVNHSPDLELYEVRNRAAETAIGEWLCFLDADDELAPGYLDAMRAAASGPAVLYPAVQYVYGDHEDPPAMLGGHRPLLELNRAVVGSLVPRSLFLDVGGFGPEPIYEDWDLWLRCSRLVALEPVEAAVYRVFVHPSSRNIDRRLMREWYRTIQRRYTNLAV